MLFDYKTLFRQIASSLFAGSDTNRRLTARRLRFFCVFGVLFVYGQVSGRICLALDHLFYRRFRRVDLSDRSLFIVGNFRSGSTFLHRLLAGDEETFTALKTWEIYLAPSILQRKLFRGLKIVDGWLGAPLYRMLRAWDAEFLQGVPFHRISLWKPEEDVGILLYAWYSLFSWFFFPDWRPIEQIVRFDEAIPAPRRRRIIAFYAGCLRRHLYAHRTTRIVVSKNPSFSPMIQSFHEFLPRVRFVGLVRDPLETTASTLDWFSYAWHFFADPVERYPFVDHVVEMVAAWYTRLARAEGLPEGEYLSIRFEDLVNHTVNTVYGIYTFLDVPVPRAAKARLQAEAERARGHTPDGAGRLDRMEIDRRWLIETFRDTIRRYGFPHQGEADQPTGGGAHADLSSIRAVDQT